MMTLYDDPMSRNGFKVRLLLDRLKMPCRIVTVDIMAGETRRPEFLAKNVAGRIPVLEFDDGSCLPESNAILAYLAEGTPYLPADPRQRAEILRWMFFEQNLIECTIGTARFFKKTGKDKERPDAYADRMDTARDALAALERHLADRDWLAAGTLTVADIAVYGYVSVAEEAGLEMNDYPAVTAWRGRMAAQAPSDLK